MLLREFLRLQYSKDQMRNCPQTDSAIDQSGTQARANCHQCIGLSFDWLKGLSNVQLQKKKKHFSLMHTINK